MKNEEPRKIATLTNPAEAEVLRGFLEARGIQVMLSKEGASTAYGLTAGAFGETEVFVPASQAEEAERIFAENFGGEGETEED